MHVFRRFLFMGAALAILISWGLFVLEYGAMAYRNPIFWLTSSLIFVGLSSTAFTKSYNDLITPVDESALLSLGVDPKQGSGGIPRGVMCLFCFQMFESKAGLKLHECEVESPRNRPRSVHKGGKASHERGVKANGTNNHLLDRFEKGPSGSQSRS